MPVLFRQPLNPSSIAGVDYICSDFDPVPAEFPGHEIHKDVVDNESGNALYIHAILERPDRKVKHSVLDVLKRDVFIAFSIFIEKTEIYHFSDFGPGMSCFISTLSGGLIYF